jgi:hypothetical protein
MAAKPSMRQFAGQWETQTINISDGSASRVYQFVKLKVQPHGANRATIKGTATAFDFQTLASYSVTIKGQLAKPITRAKSGFKYAAAKVKLTFSDGTIGKGFLGLTLGMPVVEMDKFTNGGMTGSMYFKKD